MSISRCASSLFHSSGSSYTLFHCILLLLLTVQNATIVILISYTQQRQSGKDPASRFNTSHVVLTIELVKLIASLVWCAWDVISAPVATASRTFEISEVEVVEPPVGNRGTNALNGDEALKQDQELLRKEEQENDNLVVDVVPELEATAGFRAPSSPLVGEERSCSRFGDMFCAQLFHRSALPTVVPAIIYALQNYIMFVALANIEPTLFQVTYQTKTLGTALLMWIFLGRTFSSQQWMALVLLVLGVVLAQLGSKPSDQKHDGGEKAVEFKGNHIVGMLATVLAVLCSSTAAVMLEWIFKSKDASLSSYTSTKNVHLSLYSAICYGSVQLFTTVTSGVSGSVSTDSGSAGAHTSTSPLANFFRGFDELVWLMVVVQAVGGLLVALVVKHTDNIMKAFAAGCSIILSGILSVLIYSFVPGALFVFGSLLCILAVLIYSRG